MMKNLYFKIWLRGICLRNRVENYVDSYKLNRNIDKLVKQTRKSIK